MRFGLISKFAIDLDVWRNEAPSSTNSICFCHIAFWLDSKEIGDKHQTVHLSAEVAELERILNARGKRLSVCFERLDTTAILESIEHRLWLDQGSYDIDSEIVALSYWFLPINSEAFQGESAVLVEHDGVDEIIWRTSDTGAVTSIKLAPSYIDTVISQAIEWCSKMK